jgi:hypothetical protein
MVGMGGGPPGETDAPDGPSRQPPRAATGAWWIVSTL